MGESGVESVFAGMSEMCAKYQQDTEAMTSKFGNLSKTIDEMKRNMDAEILALNEELRAIRTENARDKKVLNDYNNAMVEICHILEDGSNILRPLIEHAAAYDCAQSEHGVGSSINSMDDTTMVNC